MASKPLESMPTVMRRAFFTVVLAALCLLAPACVGSDQASDGTSDWRPNPDGIDADYGLSVIRELTKGEYEGRQSGTRGGKAARAWSAAELGGRGLSVR